jgi:hypothetical protein
MMESGPKVRNMVGDASKPTHRFTKARGFRACAMERALSLTNSPANAPMLLWKTIYW